VTSAGQATRARAVFAVFARDVRKRRGKLATGMAFGIVYALARVVEPWPLKVVFDQVLFHKKAHGGVVAPFTVFGTSPYALLATAGIILVLAGLVRAISYYWEDYLLSSAAQEIVYGIRSRLYRHLHRLPIAYHQRRRTGDTLLRLSADIVELRDILIDAVVNFGTSIVLLVAMSIVMLAVDPVLTLASVLVMPIILGLSAVYGRRIRTNSRKQRKKEGQVAAVMHEAIAAISVVQLHGAADREHDRFHEINRSSLKKGLKATRLEARMNQGVELALTAGTVVVLWVGSIRALQGRITPGELVVFISYFRLAFRPLRRASKTVQRSAKALAAGERIAEVLTTEPELTDAPNARPAPPLSGRVQFDAVEFAYEPGRPVLHDVTLTIEAGRKVAIVGATGGGKSTLVSLVPRLYDPTRGQVTFDGHDLRDLTLESVREQVSVVQQEAVLLGLSIAENIRYGRPEATDAEVAAAAAAAGLQEFVPGLPDGYDTVVGERGATLSGGQRQRVAIARALVRRSPILVLDEPTTGLDSTTQRAVFDALRRLMAGTTTLLVTHHLPLVRDADEIVVLEHGRIVAQGTHDELMADCELFKQLVRDFDDSRPTAASDLPASPAWATSPAAGNGSSPSSATTSEPVRVLFYSHNGAGLGHLQRQLDLGGAYRRRHPDRGVLLANGSHAAGMFPFPDGIDYIKLPSIRRVDQHLTLQARDLPVDVHELIALRSELLEQTVRRYRPSLLVADFMPAGPHGELLPALDELERQGGRAVAGFRDVIGEPAVVRDVWRRTGVYAALRDHYDAICVYGDPRMTDFAAEYAFDEQLAARLHYCGYLGRGPQPAAVDAPLYERPFVLATDGGGVDGSSVLETFVEAASRMRSHFGGTWLMVTGPLMADSEHERLVRLAKDAGVQVRRTVPDLRAHIALADCVVAMAGYNTVTDILSYRRPAVLIPRDKPSVEQVIRARKLSDWGLAESIHPSKLDGRRLAVAIHSALSMPGPPSAPVPLTGLRAALDVFDRCLEDRRAREADRPAALDPEVTNPLRRDPWRRSADAIP
jgi:ATP-binding cassette subfamily B protein